MNKAKAALYNYQQKAFSPLPHTVRDFDFDAYPETASGTPLVKMARACGLSVGYETDAELRAKLLAEFDKKPVSKKNKKL